MSKSNNSQRRLVWPLLLIIALLVSACQAAPTPPTGAAPADSATGGTSAPATAGDALVIYSGRSENLVAPLMERFKEQLEAGRPLRELSLSPDEAKLAVGYAFLTSKPMIIVLNHGEGEEPAADVLAAASGAGAAVVSLCARIEAELAELSAEEAAEFLAEMNIAEPALGRMIRAAYAALDLQSFFTVGPDECRAWTVRRGSTAPVAAGAIHSDLQRGFIRAEVTAYDDLIAAGDMSAAKAANKVRLEGKAYVVQDGDIIEIRFSV